MAGVLFVGCASPPPAAPPSPLEPVGVRALSLSDGTGPERCFNARDDNGNGLFDEGCGVEQSEIAFFLAWEDPTIDFDLHVGGPSGEVARVGTRTQDGLAKLNECPDEGQACRSRTFESVEWDGSERVAGRYTVRVRLEDGAGSPSPRVAFLGIKLGGLARSYELTFPEGQREWVDEFDEPRGAAAPPAPRPVEHSE
ncbi:MAG TPA: hypothetical protein VLC09_10285 [Polyangiaceae bacterium]|nr:hypothetical protein [Polyangiaceae bacterium]